MCHVFLCLALLRLPGLRISLDMDFFVKSLACLLLHEFMQWHQQEDCAQEERLPNCYKRRRRRKMLFWGLGKQVWIWPWPKDSRASTSQSYYPRNTPLSLMWQDSCLKDRSVCLSPSSFVSSLSSFMSPLASSLMSLINSLISPVASLMAPFASPMSPTSSLLSLIASLMSLGSGLHQATKSHLKMLHN